MILFSKIFLNAVNNNSKIYSATYSFLFGWLTLSSKIYFYQELLTLISQKKNYFYKEEITETNFLD